MEPTTPLPSVSDLLTADDVAHRLGVTTKTLANWRARGTGPRSVRIAGRIYYTHDAFTEFWQSQTLGVA